MRPASCPPASCPLRSMCSNSIPVRVACAASNALHPNIERVTRLTALGSCSTIWLRYSLNFSQFVAHTYWLRNAGAPQGCSAHLVQRRRSLHSLLVHMGTHGGLLQTPINCAIAVDGIFLQTHPPLALCSTLAHRGAPLKGGSCRLTSCNSPRQRATFPHGWRRDCSGGPLVIP